MDNILNHGSIDLILSRPQKFYCTPIYSGHWQLRSLIISPRPNTLYYPNGKDVIVLNTKTQESYLLTTLKFEPRCLTASGEWLCCGGEKGDYAAICFCDDTQSETSVHRQTDSDTQLPTNVDSLESSRRLPEDIRPVVEITRTIGVDIVNCITIWTPSDKSVKQTYHEPVAVISNSDRSVSIVKLVNSEIIEILTLPDCVNRSVISPDGDLLISICDDPYLYIHRRKVRPGIFRDRLNSTEDYHWYFEGKIQFETQLRTGISESKGSFAAEFSPSGKYLAVATHDGVISVFDTEKIFASPVIIFTSRSNSGQCGYVRTMEFCNGPFDLLAWTESIGQVGVVDVRNLFLSRQMLILDPNLDGVEKVDVLDRLVSSRQRRPYSPCRNFLSYLGPSLAPNQRQQLRHLMHHLLNAAPFTRIVVDPPEENLVAYQESEVRAYDTDGSTSPIFGDPISPPRPIPSSSDTNRSMFGRRSSLGLHVNLTELLDDDLAQSRYLDRRTSEHDSLNQQGQESQARRRISVQAPAQALVDSDNSADRETLRFENYPIRSLESLSLSPPLGQRSGLDNLLIEYSLFEQEFTQEIIEEPPVDLSSSRLPSEFPDDTLELAQELREDFRILDGLYGAPSDTLSFIIIPRNEFRYGGSQCDSMGCCWSQDGRIL